MQNYAALKCVFSYTVTCPYPVWTRPVSRNTRMARSTDIVDTLNAAATSCWVSSTSSARPSRHTSALTEQPYREPAEIYRLLAEQGHRLRFTDTVRATMPTGDDATTPRIPAGQPALTTRRLVADHTGRGRQVGLDAAG